MEDSRIKILFVSSGGRDNILVKNQGDSLRRIGIDVDYFSNNKGMLNYLKGIFRLRRVLRNNTYDLVHAHYGWSGVVTILTLTKLPMVISFMGDDLIGTLNKNKKYTLSGKLTSKLNKYLARHVYNYTIVKSENLREYLRSVKNLTVISNGVDLETFKEIEKAAAKKLLRWDSDNKYIIFVSNAKRPEKNFALAEKATGMLGNNKICLKVLNGIPNTELFKYYSAAECLLLTSFHEGSPNVIKEAMACGCPIVSTDVGDVKSLTNSIDGCYITSFKPEDVSLKIKAALEFSKKNGRTAGRERVKQLELDSDSTAYKLKNIYTKVLKCAEFAE